MIKTKDIHKSFGALEVLKGIDLSIDKGEVVSIVGPSGAGKTTLLQILGTLSRPTSGEIEIDGVAVHTLSDKNISKFRNTKIGFVFQFHHLLPEFSAFENVCIPGYIAGRERHEVEKRAAELLGMLAMEHRLTHKPAELSGGEQQRVAIARALINSPAVLLADEPSGNLDTKNKEEIHKLFFTLRDTFGQTVVIVTHDEQLAEMSDRKIQMIDGLIRPCWNTTNSKSCSTACTTATTRPTSLRTTRSPFLTASNAGRTSRSAVFWPPRSHGATANRSFAMPAG